MPKLIFHPDISLEVKESYQWYEEQASGLGDDFLHELEGLMKQLRSYLKHGQNFKEGFEGFY